MRVYLIGMPGSGKTTVGNVLAKKMNYSFIDIDEEIEKKTGMKIIDIFTEKGENEFRRLETEVLKSIDNENAIISCGGGIVIQEENKDYMKGIIIWLDVDMYSLKQRIENDSVIRPLMQSNSLVDIYISRQKRYDKFADHRIINANLTETVRKIAEVINENTGN